MPPATDVVVLSSTPDHNSLRTPQQIPYNAQKLFGFSPRAASPPPLESPSELFRNLKNPPDEPPQVTVKQAPKKTTKRATNKSKLSTEITEDTSKSGKKKAGDERQAVLGDLEPTTLESKDNAPKKVPKPRAKRSDAGKKRGESKNKTLTGKVSKSSSAEIQQVGANTSKPSSQKDTTKDLDDWKRDGLQLEEATKRRLDWTPTKDSSQQVVELESDGDAESSQKPTPARNLSNILSGYSYTGSVSSQASNQTTEDGGPTKRRRIELMDSRAITGPRTQEKAPTEEEAQQSTTGKKPKKQNKKPKTLTARVTARYASDYTEDTDTQSTYFANARNKQKTNTKPQEPEFIVLSPEAAFKSLDDQDLMFGTCSQLEREDSPTMLRDMQTAIHASESYMEPKPQDHANRNNSSGSMISRFTAPRNLWCEASRDLDGAVAQAEVLDLVDDYDISQISFRGDVQHQSHDEEQQEMQPTVDQLSGSASQQEASKPKENSSTVEKLREKKPQPADDASKHKETASTVTESRPQMPQYNGFTDAELSKKIASYGFKAVKGRQKMIDLLRKCWESQHGTNTTSVGSSIDGPGSKSASTKPPESEKECSAPPKKTSNSKPKQAKTTAKSAAKNEPSRSKKQDYSRPTSSTPQKPLSQKSFADVEEIEDSEDEPIPSPSRLQSRYKTPHHTDQPSSQPLPISPLPCSPSRAAASKPKPKPKPQTKTTTPGTKDDSLPDLATQITKAVRAQPRMSSSASGPSWHEKILLYDPIVLEDFATWLNTEGLGLVAEDREVGAGFLRRWCESKGICCCFGNFK